MSLTSTSSTPWGWRGSTGEVVDAAPLRTLFFAYVILFAVEGGLRKWVFPSLATPLLIVRDPIAIAAISLALYRGRFPLNGYVMAFGLAGIYSLLFTLTVGHGHLAVALYGARLWLIHVPAAFVFATALRRKDVAAVGRVLMWVALPIALLVAVQFYSPQSAFVNRGVGGDLSGSGFDGALGYYRPSGLFSFTSGNQAFFTLCGAYALGFWLKPNRINLLPLVLGTVGVLLAIPVSLSRGYVFALAVVVAFSLLAALTSIRALGRAALAALVIVIGVALFSSTEAVSGGLEALSTRFSNAGAVEGGLKGTLVYRALGDLYRPLLNLSSYETWGVGLGLGTNAGAGLLYGERMFLVDEGEWGRVLGEMGPLLGLVIILARVWLTGHLAIRSWRAAIGSGEPLAWVLLGAGFFSILRGQLGVPMELGYFTIIVALVIAASRRGEASVDTA